MPSKRRIRWASLAWILAPVLLWAALRQTNFVEIWEVLSQLRWWQVGVLIGANLLILILFVARWSLGLAAFQYEVGFLNLLAYRVAGFGVTYFTPGPQVGGEPLQIFLLTRRDNIPGGTALASVFLDRLVDLLSNFTFLVIGLITSGLIGFHDQRIGDWGFMGAVLVLAFPISHLWLLRNNHQPLARAGSWINRHVKAVWMDRAVIGLIDMENQIGRFLREQPVVFLKIIGLSALTWLAVIVEFGLMMVYLGLKADIIQVISILTMVRLAFLLPIPAGVGVLEASLVFGIRLAGFDPAVGIAAALLIRGRDVVLGGIGLWLGSWLVK